MLSATDPTATQDELTFLLELAWHDVGGMRLNLTVQWAERPTIKMEFAAWVILKEPLRPLHNTFFKVGSESSERGLIRPLFLDLITEDFSPIVMMCQYYTWLLVIPDAKRLKMLVGSGSVHSFKHGAGTRKMALRFRRSGKQNKRCFRFLIFLPYRKTMFVFCYHKQSTVITCQKCVFNIFNKKKSSRLEPVRVGNIQKMNWGRLGAGVGWGGAGGRPSPPFPSLNPPLVTCLRLPLSTPKTAKSSSAQPPWP